LDRFPDVLGLRLPDAEKLLRQAGISYKIEETVPKKRQPVEGAERIIRQIQKDDHLLLTICKIPEQGAKDEQ
jgi:hypothetical protein